MILHETFANVSSSSVNTNLSKQFISLRQQIIKIIVLVYIFSPRLTGISPTLSITLKTYLIQSLTTLNKFIISFNCVLQFLSPFIKFLTTFVIISHIFGGRSFIIA